MNTKGFWSSANAREIENFGYTYAEISKYKGGEKLLTGFARKYAWSSQAYNGRTQKPVIPDEMVPVLLTESPVFRYETGTLDSRLSRELRAVSRQEISRSIASPTPAFQHTLAVIPKVEDAETIINVAALEGQTVQKAPVVIKDPSSTVLNTSRGPPNERDEQLLEGKATGTNILRQWYVDTQVEK